MLKEETFVHVNSEIICDKCNKIISQFRSKSPDMFNKSPFLHVKFNTRSALSGFIRDEEKHFCSGECMKAYLNELIIKIEKSFMIENIEIVVARLDELRDDDIDYINRPKILIITPYSI